MVLNIDSPSLFWSDGTTTNGQTQTIQIPLNLHRNQAPQPVRNQDFYVYPSPASELVNIHLNGDDFIESLIILDAMGRQVYQSGTVEWEHAEIDVSNLPEGFYVASARTATGQVTKKFQIMR